MALFKIFKGLAADLPSSYTEGYCYFTTDDAKLYIDTDNTALGRKCLNGEGADIWKNPRIFKIGGASVSVDGSQNYEWTLNAIGALGATDRGLSMTVDANNIPTVGHSNTAITAKTAYASTATSVSANNGSFTITDIKYDSYGHITSSQDRTIKISQKTYTLEELVGSSVIGSASKPIYWTGNSFSTISNLSLLTSDSTTKGVEVGNSNGTIALYVATNRGIYDTTNSKWILYTNSTANNVYIPVWSSIGSAVKGVYFNSDGKPVAMSYEVNKTVPSDAVFTDTVTTVSTVGDGNAITSITASNGQLTITKGSTFLTSHQSLASYATKTYVNEAISSLIDSAPDTLDTLNELATALGNDENFSTTITNLIGEKIPKSIGTAAGDIIYWSAAGQPVRLGKGSNGQVLKLSNGLPIWSNDNNTTYTFTNKSATLAWSTTSTIATVGGVDITVTMPANPNVNTNYYHKTGSWSGLTYTAGKVGSPDDLVFTIPTGTTASTVAVGNHTHSYLPLSGGTLTGTLNLQPASGEGGELHLCASTSSTTTSGIILDNYYGDFRIFGIPSSDGSTITGTGTPLVINPYSKTITGGYTITGSLSGTASKATADASGNIITTTYSQLGHTHTAASMGGPSSTTSVLTSVKSTGAVPTFGDDISADDITNWSAGSGSYTQGSFDGGSGSYTQGSFSGGSGSFTQGKFSGGSGSFSFSCTTETVAGAGALSFSHTHTAATHAADSHTHTAATHGTDSHTHTAATHGKDSHSHTAPTLTYTARSIPNVTDAGSMPTFNTGSVASNTHTHTFTTSGPSK